MSIADSVRKRGLITLLAFTFFMVIGFTLVMPLIAVHFVKNLGFAAAAVGLALAVRQITQQGLAVFGGMLADRLSIRALICGGVLLRAVGFGSLAWADTLPALFFALILSALGGVLFEMPYQKAIAVLTTDSNRPRYYSLNNVVIGIATTVGPLIGVVLLRFNFQLVCLVAAICFGVTFLLARLLLPPIVALDKQNDLGYGIHLVRRDRAFLALTGMLIVYWFTAVQINISFPLLAEQLTGTTDSVGIVFALHALMTALLQYPLIHVLDQRFSVRHVLVIGAVIMSLGIGAIALVQTFAFFLLCVGVFTLGTLLARPNQQALIIASADQRMLGTYLGVSSLGLALGGGFGTFVGGWLIDVAENTGWFSLPWIVFCGVGIMSAIGFTGAGRLQPQTEQAEQPSDESSAVVSHT